MDEFTVFVTRDFGMNTVSVPLCGLCGGDGILKTNWKPPWMSDSEEDPFAVESYCICPNGRSLRKKARGTKWGDSSLIATRGCSVEKTTDDEKDDDKDLWDHVTGD